MTLRRTAAVIFGTAIVAIASGAVAAAPSGGMNRAPAAREAAVLPTDRATVSEALLNDDVYIAVAAAEGVDAGRVSVDALGVRLEDGEAAMAVFTDRYKLIAAFGTDVAVAPMKGRDVLALYGAGVIVVNYGGQGETRFAPADTAALLRSSGV
jgi:hypothetical protein